MPIMSEQIRADRALLGLDQRTVARAAGISIVALRQLEGIDGAPEVRWATADEARGVLEKAPVEFIDRGVRRGARSPDPIQTIKDEVDRIVARSSAAMAPPPLTDQELYDENGL